MSGGGEGGRPAGADPGPAPPPAGRLLDWAGGMLALFWGIAFSLLGFFGAVRIAFLDQWGAPCYLVGIGLMAWGLHRLRGRRGGPADLTKPVLRAALPVGLAMYFGPFVYWWRRVPQEDYFIGHLGVLALVALWVLHEINRLAAETADRVGRESFAVEARVSGLLCLLALPPAAAFLVYGIGAARAANVSLYAKFFTLAYHLPRPLLALALVPFTLTMACAWRARAVCLSALRDRAPP